MALIEPVTSPHRCADKQDIAARFSAAAAKYDALAGIQHIIADAALSRLSKMGSTGNIQGISALDIGCGTGRNTAKLINIWQDVCGMDLAPGMLKQAQANYPFIRFVQGDAEQLPWQSNSFNALFSSMALQWCDSPDKVISEVHRVLQPGGCAELAVMVEGSFPELNQAACKTGIPLSLNTLPTAEFWLDVICQQPWLSINQEVVNYTDRFNDIISLLKSINGIGASSQTDARHRDPLTRNKLQAIGQAIARQSDGALTNTYRILHVSLEKPL